ncbi:hypothetical protein SAMN04487895_101721 [Paenibacillus sophorae]|uniref:Uncharacterized protein n=1 Tax=Paenibacillus sophorae TaxID=1333845 RepID=A0A1H8H0V1_9BACL|nr:hypothetical protein [Paenibacillus sophorae]QWU14411.1 hypothetical protein KP014_21115 [Paenibacillus sophorae]SEN49972.1 hypothetical protein SAMN04487895_101721 [Paenibacillus sophorae]
MMNETTGRDEVKAMETQYKAVLAWEAEFAQQIEELSKIEESDKEAYKVANQIIQAWEDRKNIKGKKINLALNANSRRITKLENKLESLGYKFTKQIIDKHNGLWFSAITITKIK